jgi:hypothetical protein
MSLFIWDTYSIIVSVYSSFFFRPTFLSRMLSCISSDSSHFRHSVLPLQQCHKYHSLFPNLFSAEHRFSLKWTPQSAYYVPHVPSYWDSCARNHYSSQPTSWKPLLAVFLCSLYSHSSLITLLMSFLSLFFFSPQIFHVLFISLYEDVWSILLRNICKCLRDYTASYIRIYSNVYSYCRSNRISTWILYFSILLHCIVQ